MPLHIPPQEPLRCSVLFLLKILIPHGGVYVRDGQTGVFVADIKKPLHVYGVRKF